MKRILSTFTLLFMALCSLSAQKIVRFEDELSGLYGYKQQGKVIIEPQYIDASKEFSEGVAAVKIGKTDIYNPDSFYNWGYIDTKGNIVIPPQFYEAHDFSEGVASVNKKEDGWGFINHSGDFIKIDKPVTYLGTVRDGLAPFRYNVNTVLTHGPRWGAMNKEGKTVIAPLYLKMPYFENGFALVEVDSHIADYVYINLHGEEISKYASDLSEAKRLLKLYKKTEKGEAYMLWYKETYGK